MSNKPEGIPFKEFMSKVTIDMFSTENYGNGKAVLYTGYWLHSDGCFYMYEENDEEYLRLED